MGGEDELTTKCAKRKMTERKLEESRGTMIRKRRWGEGGLERDQKGRAPVFKVCSFDFGASGRIKIKKGR